MPLKTHRRWAGRDEASGERYVTDSELRSVLLAADDEFRAQMLWQLDQWTQEKESNWQDDGVTLLRDAWPRQIVAKSARVSARLCDLAFSQGARFSEYVDCVLPLVTKIDGDEVNLPILRRAKDNIVDEFPDKALALLSAVLPDDVRRWPYEMDSMLTRIGDADPRLRMDARLLELIRKWNAR